MVDEKINIVPQGINVEQTLFDIHADVKVTKKDAADTKIVVEGLTKDFTKHCFNEEKDKVELKNTICKKIDKKFEESNNKVDKRFDELKCPDGRRVADLEQKGRDRNGEIKETKKIAIEAKKKVDGIVSEKKGRKSAFADLKVILVLVALSITIITKLMELW